MAIPREKNDTPRGADNWADLETTGDVKRFLRWLILGTATDKIDTKKSAVLGQLSLYLLRTLEVSDIEARLADLEQRMDHTQEHHTPHEQHSDANTTH
jgi:hypothetical protein